MVRISKRMTEAYKNVNKETVVPLKDALDQIEKFPKTKFDETVEMHFYLNINAKSSDQAVRGTVVLPNGTGKKVRIAVFCKGELAAKAEKLGADYVGAEELIEKVNKGFLDFDCVIAAPDMMRDLSKLGRILGPRGLMPSPKSGTVTMDIEKAIEEVRAGKIEFKSDKQSGIHIGIGKRSFAKEKLLQNANEALSAINHAKPSSIKGELIRTLALSTTMGPGVKVAV